jgi:hypothetical protein
MHCKMLVMTIIVFRKEKAIDGGGRNLCRTDNEVGRLNEGESGVYWASSEQKQGRTMPR